MTERCEPPPEWRFLRYVAVPATEAQREMARQSDLYSRGDMALVWVNEGDLYMPTTPPATVAALVEALEWTLETLDAQLHLTSRDTRVYELEIRGEKREVSDIRQAARAALALYRGEAGR